MRRRPRIFYGWWVVVAAAVGLFLSTGSIVVLSFGVFFNPLSRDFHASRAAVSLAYTLHNIIVALLTPLLGRLIDRVGARRVILIGTAIFGLILLSSEILGSRLAFLYIFYAVLGLVAGTTSPVPYGVVVSHWFNRRRGLALGLIAVGLGLGGIFVPLLAQRLIATFGWRTAYATLGGAALLISLPIVGACLLDDPKQKGLQADGSVSAQTPEQDAKRDEGLSWHETRRHPTFWLMIAAFFLAGTSLMGCILHLPALLTDRGVSAQGAALASSLVGVALMLGRLGTGYLLDRVFAPRLAMLFFGGAAVGIALLWVGTEGKISLLAAFLLGLGMGAEVDIIAFMMSRYFGMRALGTAFGYGFGSYVLAGALGVWVMGAGFDLAHSYSVPLGGFFIAMLAAIGLIARLGPYRYGAPPTRVLARVDTLDT
ncbi:MAG: MFS transporter [Pseudomonadota bacterium]|nr:MFS transporter [Pseudomonadota bacterium]